MRTFLTSAVVAATISGTSALMSAELCANTHHEVGGNWYCSAVDKILYTNLNSKGTYQQTTGMDPNTGVCTHKPVDYEGAIPFIGQMSVHMRGPFALNKMAYYELKNDAAPKLKTRGSHIHRRHGHAHERRNVGDDPNRIYAVIDGKRVSWAKPGAGAPAPGAPAAAAPPAMAKNKAPKIDYAKGDWVKTADYDITKKEKTYGFTFLNHRGGAGCSGTWDMHFGNSLSYASADGKKCSPSSVPFGGVLESSDQELIVFTDKKCTAETCGFYRPGSVAYEGFAGESKAFFYEFKMPKDGKKGGPYTLQDASALWMLNADIPRVLQYGDDVTGKPCSCWSTGCGEFDVMEVLASGDDRCKSTLHRNGGQSGGDSNYFDRPSTKFIKLAVVNHKGNAVVKILDDDFKFTDKMASDVINKILTSDDSHGNNRMSIFDVTK